MEKILEARIRRLECLMKNEDMYDDYEDEPDDFDEDELDEFDEPDDFDEVEPDESDEDVSYATGIKNQSIREIMTILDGLVKQAKRTGKYDDLFDGQFYKTGACLRFLDKLVTRAGL